MARKKKNLLARLWSWLDGRKTFVGSFVGFAYMIAVSKGWVGYNQDFVSALEAVFGVGVVHKVWKYLTKTS